MGLGIMGRVFGDVRILAFVQGLLPSLCFTLAPSWPLVRS